MQSLFVCGMQYIILKKISLTVIYLNSFLLPGICNSIDRLLRRTLVRLDYEWSFYRSED